MRWALLLAVTLLAGCGGEGASTVYDGPTVAKMCADNLGVGNTDLVAQCIVLVKRDHPDWE